MTRIYIFVEILLTVYLLMSSSEKWLLYFAALAMLESMRIFHCWLIKGRWIQLIGLGHLSIVSALGALYCQFIAITIPLISVRNFCLIILAGYVSTTITLHFCEKITSLKLRLFGLLAKPVQLEDRIQSDGKVQYVLGIMTLVLSFVLLSFFVIYNNFPLFTESPALSRYLYFNGPYTSGMTRFLYRATLAAIEISVMFCLYGAMQKSTRSSLKIYLGVVSVFALILLSINASRGPLFEVFVFLLGLLTISNYISRKKIILLMISALVLLAAFSYVRERSFNPINIASNIYPLAPEIYDGTRVLGSFESQESPFLLGKTFLSDILIFIPSSLSEFRDKNEINRVTLDLLGASDIESAGGIRLTIYGIAYLNWGSMGVVLLGILMGFMISEAEQIVAKGDDRFGNMLVSTILALSFIFGIFIFMYYLAIIMVQALRLMAYASMRSHKQYYSV